MLFITELIIQVLPGWWQNLPVPTPPLYKIHILVGMNGMQIKNINALAIAKGIFNIY